MPNLRSQIERITEMLRGARLAWWMSCPGLDDPFRLPGGVDGTWQWVTTDR